VITPVPSCSVGQSVVMLQSLGCGVCRRLLRAIHQSNGVRLQAVAVLYACPTVITSCRRYSAARPVSVVRPTRRMLLTVAMVTSFVGLSVLAAYFLCLTVI